VSRGSLLRDTGLNDLSLFLSSFSLAYNYYKNVHKILWCSVVDNDLTTMQASIRNAMHPFFYNSCCFSQFTRCESWKMFKEGINGENTGLYFHSRKAPRKSTFASTSCPKSSKMFDFRLLSFERAMIFTASQVVSGCVYGFFVCVTFYFSLHCTSFANR